MWRQIFLGLSSLVVLNFFGCAALENTPQRLPSYLEPQAVENDATIVKNALTSSSMTGTLIIVNDTGFPRSAPELRKETLQSLGGYLQAEIQKHVPMTLNGMVLPEDMTPPHSFDRLKELGEELSVPYVVLAVLSGTEWEVPDRLPLNGMIQPTGARGSGLVGYRAENYSRVELALVEVQTGKVVLTTDGQAWAILHRLAVPLESNLYPVVRRALTDPPIFPGKEGDAFETLRWVSGQDAIDQAVMHLSADWKVKGAA